MICTGICFVVCVDFSGSDKSLWLLHPFVTRAVVLFNYSPRWLHGSLRHTDGNLCQETSGFSDQVSKSSTASVDLRATETIVSFLRRPQMKRGVASFKRRPCEISGLLITPGLLSRGLSNAASSSQALDGNILSELDLVSSKFSFWRGGGSESNQQEVEEVFIKVTLNKVHTTSWRYFSP